MKEKLLKIINHYGLNHQLKKLNEETFELTEAILNQIYWGNYMDAYDSIESDIKEIAEEIADVMVLLEQFKLYYEITDEDVEKIMEEKVERQLKRMEDEK